MARHRKARRPALRSVAVAGAAAGMSTALALVPTVVAAAEPAPRDIVIGIGGNRDPIGDRAQRKFNGELVGELVADGYTFEGLSYPAALPVDPSVAVGVPRLHAAIDAANGGRVVVIGYSQGALVAEQVRRDLTADPDRPPAENLQFVLIASPFVPNGGIYARFPDFALLGFTSTGPTQPSPYASTYYSMEYDIVADFPAYGNPLSIVNAAIGFMYSHGDHGPDPVDLDTHPLSVREVVNSEGGTDTYVLIRAEHLPLLQPIRDVAAAVGATVLTEPVLGAIEPTLRLLVDMGYTDRDYRTIGVDPEADYQDADRPTRFSFFTPPGRILATLAALPDALRDGAENFVDALTPPAPAVLEPADVDSDVDSDAAADAGPDGEADQITTADDALSDPDRQSRRGPATKLADDVAAERDSDGQDDAIDADGRAEDGLADDAPADDRADDTGDDQDTDEDTGDDEQDTGEQDTDDDKRAGGEQDTDEDTQAAA